MPIVSWPIRVSGRPQSRAKRRASSSPNPAGIATGDRYRLHRPGRRRPPGNHAVSDAAVTTAGWTGTATRSASAPDPDAAARWRTSPASPSLRSISAVAP